MNKTEAAYAQELENQKRVGLISWWAFEPMKLRLADKTYYTPDFAVMNRERPVAEDGVYVVAGPPKPDERRFYWREALEFHEVKGFWRDDARVKIKVAAEHFPFKFVAVRKKKLSEGGGWDVEEFCGSHS